VESWLDERGHSLVLLSNPGLVTEIDLESSEHGTLGREASQCYHKSLEIPARRSE